MNFEHSLTERQTHYWIMKESTEGSRSRLTVDMLPAVALLRIFDFYLDDPHVDDYYMAGESIQAWQTLVHVCQKWRNIVFGSPRRLNLRLRCRANTPVREMMDVWPPLPIVISDYTYAFRSRGSDNILAALEYNDRICQVNLFDSSSLQLEGLLPAMERPFPELKCLEIRPRGDAASVVPDSFLGGSAPLLETLSLSEIPFPGLPKLLLSTTHLVHLRLSDIPEAGHFSPEAMVACLRVPVLTRLETLFLGFQSHRPNQRNRRLPTQTRTLLPVLTELAFFGVGEYLEVLVAHIDAPLLDSLTVAFSHPPIFDTPQLALFIGRAPKFKTQNEARVVFDWEVSVTLSQINNILGTPYLKLRFWCEQLDQQLFSLAQVCRLTFPPALIPTVEHLYIQSGYSPLGRQGAIENSRWLEFFYRFTSVTSVKDLYISLELVPHIAQALQELVGERVTEVLPALQTFFLKEMPPLGPVRDAIERFVAARQLAGHTLAISRWE